MFKNFKTAWGIEEIRKKITYTLLLILIFRVGSYIPIPTTSPGFIANQIANYDILGFMNLLTGGSFANFTILALGITPYINASIIVQLLTIAIPQLEAMQKEGEIGRKKIERITRISGVVFALIMAIGVTLTMFRSGGFIGSNIIPTWMSYVATWAMLTAGTAFVMWLGERITEVGIGNGMSFIIFINIISRLPSGIGTIFQRIGSGELTFWIIPLLLLLVLAIITGVVYIDLGERRVPVQYAKRVVGRKMYGGQSTHIPVRVNSNGVLPLIFAITIIQFPRMILQFWPTSAFSMWYAKYMGTGSVVYFVVYFLLIVGFSFFYSAVTFNPIELSKNIQQNGGFIPGIRPGKPTSDYLSKISSRLTMFSALFLSAIAAVPTLFTSILGSGAAFGATSLLIMVSVALETNKQLEAQITMRHYKGFLK